MEIHVALKHITWWRSRVTNFLFSFSEFLGRRTEWTQSVGSSWVRVHWKNCRSKAVKQSGQICVEELWRKGCKRITVKRAVNEKSEHGCGTVEGMRRAREVRKPEYPESTQPANRRQKRRRKWKSDQRTTGGSTGRRSGGRKRRRSSGSPTSESKWIWKLSYRIRRRGDGTVGRRRGRGRRAARLGFFGRTKKVVGVEWGVAGGQGSQSFGLTTTTA